MPIKFITKNREFEKELKKQSKSVYEVLVMNIENYKPEKGKHTYYVSPANSFGWMDGGIDLSFSKMFPGIGGKVRKAIKKFGHDHPYSKENNSSKKYLPIGSSVIIDVGNNRSLISTPTMLIPQDVRYTKNAYYATISVLYNILVNCGKKLSDVDIFLTSMCCGCGDMKVEDSVSQILTAIREYKEYRPEFESEADGVVIHEPNLHEQPAYINKGF